MYSRPVMRTDRASAWSRALLALFLACPTHSSIAEGRFGADRGKLLLTAGVTTIEGAGGGGLTPWALITGYGSANSWGANVHATGIVLRDFDYVSFGAAVGILDRFELSVSRQRLEASDGVLDGVSLSQDIVGAKLRVLGDAVYAQDSWVPQVAIGALYKRHRGIDDAALAGLPALTSVTQLAATDDSGIDYYASATKLFLAHSLLLDVTMRYTKSNQFGLLGFGGDRDDDAGVQAEASVACLLRRSLAVGIEYRARSENLSTDEESAAWDAFVAWAPNRAVSFVAGYVNIGSVLAPVTGNHSDQDGAYVSVQIGF
jgi:hypothetical protein